MFEQETQAPQGTDTGTSQAAATGQPDMSDDDVAALLGFTTTLSEQMHFPQDQVDPNQVGDAQKGDGQATDAGIQKETPGTPKKDEEQDKEIADIRAQLEQLLAEEQNGKETENTGTAG